MKKVALALLFAFGLATVVGCGGSPTSAPKPAGSEKKEEKKSS